MRPRTDDSEARVRPVGRVLDVLLVCAAVAGVLSLVWWAAAAFLGLGLVTFATGSMSPKYPTGSLAVTMPVALDRVQLGDVVTVQRGHGLAPITHRVIAVDVASSGRSATIRLKGDANTVQDPTSYHVTSLRRVILPLPAFADVLRFTDSPAVVLGIAAVIVGSLAFAFWPERIRPRHRDLAAVPVRTPVDPLGRHAAS